MDTCKQHSKTRGRIVSSTGVAGLPSAMGLVQASKGPGARDYHVDLGLILGGYIWVKIQDLKGLI